MKIIGNDIENKSEKINKYLDLAREQKQLWNMRVTVIPVVIGALGTVLKDPKIRLAHLEL